VSTGTPIGESGGDDGDPNNPNDGDDCYGYSTGSHLHFQIDKTHPGVNYPYFPSNVDTPDNSFTVTNYTYNPIIFITGGYRWTFWQNNNREGWNLFNLQSWGVSGGALWMDGQNDPYIRRGCDSSPCAEAISAEANMYKKVHLDMYNNCVNNPLKIYFTTSSQNYWDENKTVSYNVPSGASNFHVQMNGNPYWTGIITGLRVDPASSCSVGFDPAYYGNITIER
jgi:hypothetical protein